MDSRVVDYLLRKSLWAELLRTRCTEKVPVICFGVGFFISFATGETTVLGRVTSLAA